MNLTINTLSIAVPNLHYPILSIPHLRVDSQQHLAILGPSGSGKSTFLNAISGLIQVQPDQIKWGDIDLYQLSATQRDTWRFQHIGMIMQDFYLTTGLTALENVLLPYSFRHWRIQPTVRQRAIDLLATMNFEQFDRPVEYLSRGEMQRVAIARALLCKPEIIIADEPTASLDAENGRIITELLIRLAKQESCTLIVSTHDRYLAEQLSRRIYLKNGQIEREESLC
ncbi:ABC transporter ATP-binding protein [Nicoletella semolina]|nr:ATP-binding cassette domain-containing protein [Nicoletella semolina]